MSNWYGINYPNRLMCEVLESMRKQVDVLSESTVVIHKEMLSSLIEEVQVMGDRMESALSDAKDIRDLYKERSELQHEVKELKDKKKKLDK